MTKLTGLDLKRGPDPHGRRPKHVAETGTPQQWCPRLCCTWELTNEEVRARSAGARARWST